MRILAVIPARYAASRFPGKPLADLGGRPVIEWVYGAAAACGDFHAVVVATDDERIADAVRAFGGDVEMTRSDHATGSDRVAEVAGRRPEYDVVANVQGDQPFATPDMLESLVAPYVLGERPPMTTLACPLEDPVMIADPNTVKVVCDQRGMALYFSRAAIPHGAATALHHMGLYAFTRETLLAFPAMEPTPLEQAERLEQLRAMEHGVGIRVCRAERHVLEINTAEDLEAARELV